MKILIAFLLLCGSLFAQITNGSQQTFNSTTGTHWQGKQFYDVRDSGIDCTGVADSTTALQNLINSVPDYSSIHFPQACKVKVSGTTAITIDQRYGLQFVMEGRNGNNCLSSTGQAQIFYNQAYGAGNRVLYINRSQDLEFRNLMVNVNGGGDIGIDIDQVGATPPINTRNDFYSPCIANQVNRNSSFRGIRVSNSAISNVENIHFYHPDILCSTQNVTSGTSNGVGIIFSSSFNQKNEIVEDVRTTNCSTAVDNGAGSTNTVMFGLGSSSWSDILMDGFNDMVFGYRSENAQSPITLQQATGNHLIMHNDFAAQQSATAVIDCLAGCGQVTLIGNRADSATNPWFKANTGTGSLFSAGNLNSNLNPLNWQYSWNFEPSSGGTNKTFISSSLRLTPSNQFLTITNSPTPPLIFETINGASQVLDRFVVDNFGEGNFNNTAPQNFSIFYEGTSPNYITLGSPIVGVNVGPNPTAAPVINSVSTRGTTGSTTWCYAVVANTITGHSAASTPVCIANGNATLNGTNFQIVILNWYAGAINYDVYRTTAGGTPSTTGKIGTVKPRPINGGGTIQGGISLSDTGLAGDGTTAPATNTTGGAVFGGQVQSTVTTGTAPLIIASTTNVPNLNASSLNGATFAAPGPIGSGTPSTGAFTTVNATSATFSGAPSIITGTASNTDLAGKVTLSTGSGTYTFAGTYATAPVCVATDTTAVNAVKAATSTTVLTLTGTGSDVIAYHCIGLN